jgi:UDP:flavonoid glycosyltransferase YjiC (YdhE family)
MTDYLFAAWDGGGAVPPLLALAASLRERGHDVRILADPVLREEVEAVGAEYRPWTRAPHRIAKGPEHDLFRDWEAHTPFGAFARVRDGLMCGRAADVAADVVEELDRRPADVVVAEVVLLGALIAAEARGIPCSGLLTTLNMLPTEGLPPFGPALAPARGPLGRLRDRALARMTQRLWDSGLEPVNAARAGLGLPPLGHTLDQITRAERLLLLTSAAFDRPRPAGAPRGNLRYVGPRLHDPAWSGDWTPPAGDAPLVLVGLSSSYMRQEPVLRRAVAALGTLSVRGLVTTGPELDPARVPAAPNVTVVRAAPHGEVMPHAAAVVTHCGHGTVMKALAAGVPLVCLPMGRDQLEVAARVVALGAGVRLRPGASTAAIARAVRTVLEDPSYRSAARRMAQTLAQEARTDHAVAELEGLAARPGPVLALAG